MPAPSRPGYRSPGRVKKVDFPAVRDFPESTAFQPIKVGLFAFTFNMGKKIPYRESLIPEDCDSFEFEAVPSRESPGFLSPNLLLCVFQAPILPVFQKMESGRGGIFEHLEVVLGESLVEADQSRLNVFQITFIPNQFRC